MQVLSLLDIQEALDGVNHEILCKNLKALGVKSTMWFEPYLTQRFQIVNVNGVNSSPRKLICGVPQGSILGPLLFLCYVNFLFLCYVNDIPMLVDCIMLQYADDTPSWFLTLALIRFLTSSVKT